MSAPKPRLRTIREAYQQVRWDPRLDARAFVVGYESRGHGIKEVAFDKFVPDGDVPFHRVRYLRVDTLHVWDRDTRTDLLETMEQLPERAKKSPEKQATKPAYSPSSDARSLVLQPIAAWRFDPFEHAWRTGEPAYADETPAPPVVTAVTWNVLFDQFEAERLATDARIPAALAELARLRAHVISLQEVTPRFLDALLREPWVRAHYTVSDGPEGPTVTPSGQVLLSRLPVRSFGRHDFSRHKRAIVGELFMGQTLVTVYALHLTSDHTENGAYLRAKQLRAVYAHAARVEGAALVLGDLNRDDPEGLDEQTEAGFSDVWTDLRPMDSGATYDPTSNPLAAIFARHGRALRIDRVLSRGEELEALAIRRFATAPFARTPAPLFASDHFGLCAAFRLRASARAEASSETEHAAPSPVHHSALAFVPPPHAWGPIQAIRRVHDERAFTRWPPHINLRYPFVPAAYFARTVDALADALAAVDPPRVTLARFAHFTHARHATVYLAPDDPQQSLETAARLVETVLDPTGLSERPFTPHLTVARVAHEALGAAPHADPAARVRHGFTPVECTLSTISLLGRDDEEPFAHHYELTLGGGPVITHEPARQSARGPLADALDAIAPAPDASERDAVSSLVARVTEAARAVDPNVYVELGGSRRVDLASRGSDLDLLVVGPPTLSASRFFADLASLFDDDPHARLRAVLDARVPVLRGTVGRIALDVLYAACPAGVPLRSPSSLVASELARFDPDEQRAVMGVLDLDALFSLPIAREDPHGYRLALRALRAFARARGLSSNAFGLPGGFAWALLGAWALRDFAGVSLRTQAPEAAARALLTHTLERLAAADLRGPLSLTDAPPSPDERRDTMTLYTPVFPRANATRNGTEGTRALLVRELLRASRLARTESWSALLAPIDPLREGHSAFVEITARGETPDELRDAQGWILGHALGLLVELERDAGSSVRAYPDPIYEREGTVARYRIGLGTTATAARVAAACSAFRARFEADRTDRATRARVTAAFVHA